MRQFALVAVLASLASAPRPSSAQVQVTLPGVRVSIAPPALRYEVTPPAPSPRHQWIPGSWGWRGAAHVWMGGHWALPPAYGYVWEPARWENAGGAWVLYDGHWRPSDQPDRLVPYQPPPPPVEEVVVAAPPPAPIEEVRPPPPFAQAVWVPGYWQWSGVRYVWAAGRWSPRPAGYMWEPHRWERRDDGKWVHRTGHWHPRDRDHDDGRHEGHRGEHRHQDD
jgi:WXXGXW repeat (2 copies)